MSDSWYLADDCENARKSNGAHLTRLAKVCQTKSLQGEKPIRDPAFAGRLRQAFGGAKDAEIARKLGYKSQSPITKFMSGVYPGPEVLMQISRVTKHSVDWLLTGEGESSADPLQFLDPGLRAILEKIAADSDVTIEEAMSNLLTEAILARGSEMFGIIPQLRERELEQLRLMVQAFDPGQSEIEAKPSSASRKKAS